MFKQNLVLAIFVLLSIIPNFGCLTASGRADKFTPIVPKLEQSEITGYIKEIESEIKDDRTASTSDDVFVEEDTLKQNKPTPTANEFKVVNNEKFSIEVNESVESWIRYFAEKDHERFQRFLDRGEKYRAVIEETLAENEMPKELYYLAMIESGFATHARSHASAVGVWQFIKPTAQRYGLQVDYYVDERMDPMRSTEAAASYLKDLHTVFQSWYLAMSAYNSGEMRVLGAIMRHSNRDYWSLVEKKALPRETMNYVPKVLAAAIIGNHPDRFGFVVKKEPKIERAELVAVPTRVRLSDIAKKIGLSNKALKDLNPHLRRGIVPDNKSDYKIWVPASLVQETEKSYQYLAEKRVRRPVMVAEEPSVYRVKPGDNLTKISQRFGVSIQHIKKLNRLSSNQLYVGRNLKIYDSNTSESYQSHRVRRGESLASIAHKYGSSVSRIKSANNIKGSQIYAGTNLKVPSNYGKSLVSHKVRPGESLFRIAKKYGVSINQIKRLNKLQRNNIYAGQVLKVKSKM